MNDFFLFIFGGLFFNCFYFLKINEAFPFRGLPSIDHKFIIKGEKFDKRNEIFLKFGAAKLIPIFNNSETLEFILPYKSILKKKKINIKLFFKNGKRKRKYIFKKKFTYSPNPILYDSYPRYIPNTGSFIMINGENLENEPNKINCFLDELVFSGKLISNNKLLCNITELKILKYSPYKISISLNGFKVYAQDLFVSFYGLNRIDPNKGPFKTKIEIYFYGFGFFSNLQGYCNFELIPYPKIVKAHILNDTTIKCITPSNIQKISTSKSNFYANVYIAFNEKNITKYEKSLHYKESLLWVISGSSFYFYSVPYSMKIIPDTVEINKISSSIYVKSIGSWNFQHTLVSYSNLPIEMMYFFFSKEIKCDFQDFGITSGILVENDLIECPVPNIKLNVAFVFRVAKMVKISFNGHNFHGNKNLILYFTGNQSPMIYTWIFVWTLLGILFVILIIISVLRFQKYYKGSNIIQIDNNEN